MKANLWVRERKVDDLVELILIRGMQSDYEGVNHAKAR